MSPFRFDIDLFIKKPYPLLFAQQDIPNIYVLYFVYMYLYIKEMVSLLEDKTV